MKRKKKPKKRACESKLKHESERWKEIRLREDNHLFWELNGLLGIVNRLQTKDIHA